MIDLEKKIIGFKTYKCDLFDEYILGVIYNNGKEVKFYYSSLDKILKAKENYLKRGYPDLTKTKGE